MLVDSVSQIKVSLRRTRWQFRKARVEKRFTVRQPLARAIPRAINLLTHVLAGRCLDDAQLTVFRTAGQDMGEQIDRTRYGAGEWLPDGKSFLYPRFPKLPNGAPLTDLYLRNRVYMHVLGTNPDSDRPVFGFGVNPSVKFDPPPLPFDL